jgi:periplasmic divalent cation tolerance protein
MLVIKARSRSFVQLERRVRELHSYEVPEIVAMTLTAGSKPYLAWLAESTRQLAPSLPPKTRRRGIRQ